MATQTLGSQALRTARSNPNRAWNAGQAGASAKDRLTSGDFLRVRHTPKFRIKRDAPIFTMGSCFAREVENTLTALGAPLVLKGHGIEAELYESWDEATGRGGGAARGQLSRGAFNKYTVHSMSHELRRVLLDEEHEHDGLIELEPSRWFDPHAAGLKTGVYEQVRATRARVAAAMREIRHAQVVFLTLGLVEGWTDTRTGLAMNRIPTGMPMARLADRFALMDYTYDEILAELIATIGLVREVCSTDMRFVITVSPVPFGATFRDLDVVVANTASKAALRTAADEVAKRFDFVDYFPSFELVTNSPRAIAWLDDQIHVHPRMVGHVTSFFADCYLER